MAINFIGWTVAAIFATLLLWTQVGDTSLEPNYFCNTDKQLTAFCYDLSASKLTCYTQINKTGGKQCRNGEWELFPVAETVSLPEPVKEKSSFGIFKNETKVYTNGLILWKREGKSGLLKVSEVEIDDIPFVQRILEDDIEDTFRRYNDSSTLNQLIEYRDHPLFK